ncbi:hypothetical protein NL676_034592 [Syzygium grande]|nr:hypothetical protein NL676_034592 [Syzygium grande]
MNTDLRTQALQYVPNGGLGKCLYSNYRANEGEHWHPHPLPFGASSAREATEGTDAGRDGSRLSRDEIRVYGAAILPWEVEQSVTWKGDN